MTRPATAMTIPTRAICGVVTRPVAVAMALGGVEIGRDIPKLEATAMAMVMKTIEPAVPSAPEVPRLIAMGTRSAVVAVCERKLASRMLTAQKPASTASELRLPHSMRLISQD